MTRGFLVGSVLFLVFVTGSFMALERRSPFESALDELTFLVFGEDTELAPGYTDDAFSTVGWSVSTIPS